MATYDFERGDPSAPAGHAFLYFRSGTNEQVSATYIVVPPVPLDFGKYVPPLLASSLGASGLLAQASFLPIPPLPEEFALGEIRRLAELRGDDVLVASAPAGADPMALMTYVAEVGDAYARSYAARLDRAPSPAAHPAPASNVEGLAVLYSVLSERERIEEIARRIGTLRYAIEGGDRELARATEAEVRAIATYLPERFRTEELLAAARGEGAPSARLAQLFVERGYGLCNEDVEGVRRIEEEIVALQMAR